MKQKARQLEVLRALVSRPMLRLKRHRYAVNVNWHEAGIAWGSSFRISSVPVDERIALRLARILYPHKRKLTVKVRSI
jgi:hypothetical protein